MDRRWLLLGFALLFGALTVAFVAREKGVQAAVAGLQALVALGLFRWYTARDDHGHA